MIRPIYWPTTVTVPIMNPGVDIAVSSQGAMQCHTNWPVAVKTTVKLTVVGTVS